MNSQIEKRIKEIFPSYSTRSTEDTILVSKGRYENPIFTFKFDGEYIYKAAPTRGFTSPEERQQVRNLVSEWNGSQDTILISEEDLKKVLSTMSEEYEDCQLNGNPLVFLYAYRKINIDVIQKEDTFEWGLSLVNSPDTRQKGTSSSYEDLEKSIKEAVATINNLSNELR